MFFPLFKALHFVKVIYYIKTSIILLSINKQYAILFTVLTFCSSPIHCIGNVQRLRNRLKNGSAQDAQNQPNDVLVSILYAEHLQASCSSVVKTSITYAYQGRI